MTSDPYTFGCGVIAKDQLVDPCPDDALKLLGSSSLCLDRGVHGYHTIRSRRISTPQTTFVPDSRQYDDGRFFFWFYPKMYTSGTLSLSTATPTLWLVLER